MLFHLLFHFLYPRTQLSVLNVTRYITFRTAAASLSALAISLILGPWMIRKLREFQIGQVIRQEGPQTHRPKAGTPTMGGLLILTASLVPTLLWADLTNVYVWIAVMTTVLTMSCTRQPRLRSFTGLFRPCSTGPMATAPEERCTAL